MLTPWSNRFAEPSMVCDPFLQNVLGDFGTMGPRVGVGSVVNSRVRVDLIERADDFVMTADLPGFPKENIDLQIEANNVITITANKSEARESSSEFYHRQERSCERVVRSITLPANANLEQCKATYRDGCLILEMPKLATTKGGFRKLAIA